MDVCYSQMALGPDSLVAQISETTVRVSVRLTVRSAGCRGETIRAYLLKTLIESGGYHTTTDKYPQLICRTLPFPKGCQNRV